MHLERRNTITFLSVSRNMTESCVFQPPSSLSITLHGRIVVGTFKTATGPRERANTERETLTAGIESLYFTDMQS